MQKGLTYYKHPLGSAGIIGKLIYSAYNTVMVDRGMCKL